MTKKKANILYSFIQIFYFATIAVPLFYTSAYLMDRNFTNGQIGLFLGICNVITVVAQIAVAEILAKSGKRWNIIISVLLGLSAVVAVALLIVPMNGMAFAIAYGAAVILLNVVQPSVNSLYRGYHNQGIEIDYARARGFGSAAISLASLLAGQCIARMKPSLAPLFMVIPLAALIVCILLFRAPNVSVEKQEKKVQKEKYSLLRDCPHFIFFIAGIALIASAHCFAETYLLQIIQNIGGDSGNLGIATAISTATELPAMLAYKRLSAKFGNRKLMILAGWMWCLKSAAIIFAPSVYLIYAAELLQFVGYAIYVPAAAKHIAHALPESAYLRGQALAGSALTVGGLIATLLGGQLIDIIGLRPSLLVMQSLSVIGIIFFTVSIIQSLKIIPSRKSDENSDALA